jgi:streptomycin 6-kinase
VTLSVPAILVQNCAKSSERGQWLERLPAVVEELQGRWSLRLAPPFDGPEVSAAWVAPATRSDGSPAVFKISMPHMEADHEAAGLRFWDGHPTVRLLDADDELRAMLLERCIPGTCLRSVPEQEQDVILAGLLRDLWRTPDDRFGFRPLSDMIEQWVNATKRNEERWPDPPLVRDGLAMFAELLVEQGSDEDVVLATDLHAGNVLRAERAPWLVIDPKPFVGERAYDATQHLLNCEDRMLEAPLATIERFARLLDVDPDRVRRWMFARAAAENRDNWTDDTWTSIARALRP